MISPSRPTIWPLAAALVGMWATPAPARPPQVGPSAPRASRVIRAIEPTAATPTAVQMDAPLDDSSVTLVSIDAPPPATESAEPDASTPEGLALALSRILRDAIPRQYEKKKDWDQTKRITTGLRSEGNFFDFDIRRRKKEVKHGNWQHYRVQMIDPEDHLEVRVENLRSLAPGQIAFTVYFSAPLDGWAQTRVYNRSIHFITLTAEGRTTLRLWIDCEVALSMDPATLFTSMQVSPVVTEARLELDDFNLERISKASGPIVHELGKGLRYLILEELEGPALVAKLNRAIDKKRDRLKFAPGELFKLPPPVATDAPQ